MIFEAYAETTFPIEGLNVQYATLGSKHLFRHQGRRCWITLPPFEMIGRYNPVSVARRSRRAGAPDDDLDAWYGVYLVTVSVELEPVTHDKADPAYRREFAPSRENQRLFRDSIPSTLKDVLERWLRVCRWIAQTPLIDARNNEQVGSIFQPGFRVYRSTDDELYDAFGGTFVGLREAKIEADVWRQIESALATGESPPLWFDYIAEAQIKLRRSDVGGAVASGAIACETILRAVFWLDIPTIASSIARDRIDDIPAQALLRRWPELARISPKAAKANGQSAIHKLFDLRNDLMHRGDLSASSYEQISDLLDCARGFIKSADEIYRQRLSVAEPECASVHTKTPQPFDQGAS